MSIIVVPEQWRAKLTAAEPPIEFRSADGRVLGHFTPTRQNAPALDPRISEEEIERRLAAGGGRPLADILRDLEKRA